MTNDGMTPDEIRAAAEIIERDGFMVGLDLPVSSHALAHVLLEGPDLPVLIEGADYYERAGNLAFLPTDEVVILMSPLLAEDCTDTRPQELDS